MEDTLWGVSSFFRTPGGARFYGQKQIAMGKLRGEKYGHGSDGKRKPVRSEYQWKK